MGGKGYEEVHVFAHEVWLSVGHIESDSFEIAVVFFEEEFEVFSSDHFGGEYLSGYCIEDYFGVFHSVGF